MPTLDPIWGPYRGPDDARSMLSGFVDRACGPAVGIAWAAGGRLYPLRAPGVAGSGRRHGAPPQWPPAPPPPLKPPVGFWPRVWAGLQWCMDQEGKAALQEARANQAMAQGVNQVLSRMLHSHQDDGLGVAFDILAIGLSLALIPTGIGMLGVLGLVGGGILLAADGGAYAMELAGDDEGAERIKQRTEYFRIMGTLMTLPDIGWNGVKMIGEIREIQAMRAVNRATAVAAENAASRAASAARARRLQQVAERAHLRAQIRSEQLAALFRLEVSGRAVGTGSVGLLVREEWLNDESAAHAIARRLQIHTTTVHR